MSSSSTYSAYKLQYMLGNSNKLHVYETNYLRTLTIENGLFLKKNGVEILNQDNLGDDLLTFHFDLATVKSPENCGILLFFLKNLKILSKYRSTKRVFITCN